MKILGIETSCDETAASVIDGNEKKIKVLSDVVASQIEIHKKYGGVVPEVAAREHVLNILPVIKEALEEAGIKNPSDELDAIAVTKGSGLVTSLIVGVETAKTLSYAWNVPIIGLNHIEGHIYANFVGEHSAINNEYPILILTVSGGHTMLVLMEGHGKFKTIGETRDDAAGEAFDKAAKLMGIGYPGGPVISAEAEKLIINNEQLIIDEIKLPRPMINSQDFDFSFSGLKTAIRYALDNDKNWEERIPKYAHEFQQAVVDVLVSKTVKAARKHGVKNVMLAGGVAANKELRKQLEKAVRNEGIVFRMPELKYTTDNAVMIAVAGYFRAQRKKFVEWKELLVDCGMEL